MAEFIISAFADEAGITPEEQIEALQRNGIRFIEPRFFNKKGVLTLSDEELIEIKKALDKANIKVNSLGSPIGKYPINEPFEKHLEDFKRAIEVCKILDTKNIRIFSFFIPNGEPPEKYSDEVIARMTRFSEIAKKNGITLNHENEKDIFGQNPPEVDYLVENLPDIKFIFDGANYRMAGCDVHAGMSASIKNFGYFHIKDAIHEAQTIVPVGEGEAHYEDMIRLVDEKIDGTVYMTIEPHLHVFDAFKSIDNTELRGKYSFASNREAFDFATSALKKLLTKLGFKENDGIWKK
jgi:sugar phosphate isomerase/epimerase